MKACCFRVSVGRVLKKFVVKRQAFAAVRAGCRARGRARRACHRCTIRPYRIRCICPRLLPLAYPFARGIVRQLAFHVCVGMPSKRSLSLYCVRCRHFKAARWWQAPPLGPYGPYAAKDAAQGTPWRARGGREGRQKLGRQGAMRTPYVQ